MRGLEWTGRNAPGLSEPSALTYSAEQLLGRAAFIDKQIETWKGNPGYIDTLRMEAYALRRAAQTPGAVTKSDGCVEGHAPMLAHGGDCLQAPAASPAGIKPGPSDPSSTRSNVTANNRFAPRMLVIDAMHAVCVGGRWDGWKFYKHPDGQWVSLEKLNEERP